MMIEKPYSQMMFFGRVKNFMQQCAQQCQMLKPMTKAPKMGEVAYLHAYFATYATLRTRGRLLGLLSLIQTQCGGESINSV